MQRILEKVERRLGEKLFLKGDRCLGPKCATVRRNYIPGAHGRTKSKRRGNVSEFSILMREKQKVRYLYGLDDKRIAGYNKKATAKPGVFSENFIQLLETRLDNTVYRLGLTASRRIARQVVSHGHVLVNGRTVNIPSYAVRRGDTVSLKERVLSFPLFAELDNRLKGYELPRWLELDRQKKIGTVVRMPEADDAKIVADITKIKEFYSR